MIRPSEWYSTFAEAFPHQHHQRTPVFKEPDKEPTQMDILSQIKKKREEDRKRDAWESEFEKMRQEFMSSTPFQSRRSGDHFSPSIDEDHVRPRTNTTFVSNSSSKDVRNGTNGGDHVFKVELDIREFEPESVKVKLENGSVLVMEAKQTSRGYTKELNRSFRVPPGTNTDRLVCRLLISGLLIAEVPAPPSYTEACKECKLTLESKSRGKTRVHDTVQDSHTKHDTGGHLRHAEIGNARKQFKEPGEFGSTPVSTSFVEVSEPAQHIGVSSPTKDVAPGTPRLTRIKRATSSNGYDNISSSSSAPTSPEYDNVPVSTTTTPGGTRIVREYEVNRGANGFSTLPTPRRAKVIRESSETSPERPVSSKPVTRHSVSVDSADSAQQTQKVPGTSVPTADTPPTRRRTQIIREYEQKGDETPTTARRTEIIREYKTPEQEKPLHGVSSTVRTRDRSPDVTEDFSAANDGFLSPVTKRTTIIRDYLPAPSHSSRSLTTGRPRHGENLPDHVSRTKFERTHSTPVMPRHTEIIRDYTSTPSSPRLTRLMRSNTETHVPSSAGTNPIALGYATLTPGIKPRSSEFASRTSTRRYAPATVEYVPTPSSKKYTLNNARSNPSRTEFSTSDGHLNGDTFTYSPITIKYSTLPTKSRQKTHKVLVGRSNSNAADPRQWRSSRQPRISLSDSVDSEATLSSSPSDDLYQGHSSFSDELD